MNPILDLPLFAPIDQAKMSASQRAIADHADGQWRTKREWAQIAGCSEHAFSARASELRAKGYTVERRAPNPGTGEVCGVHWYRVVPR